MPLHGFRPPLTPLAAVALVLTRQALAACPASSPTQCSGEHLLLQHRHSVSSFRLEEPSGDDQQSSGHVYVGRSLVDDEGNNIGERFQVTLDECKAACDSTPACHSFSYASFSMSCYLKDKEVTMQTLAKDLRDWDWHFKTYFPVDASETVPPTIDAPVRPWNNSETVHQHHYVERTLVADEGREIYAMSGATLFECEELCDRTLACRSFAYSLVQKSCHLKDAEVTLADAARIPAYLDFKTFIKGTQIPAPAPPPAPTPAPTPAPPKSGIAGIIDVYSTYEAFVALNKNTGNAQCWGSSTYGGACGDVNFAGVTDVYSNGLAFMALNKNTGRAQCWGDSSSGGSCSDLDFAGITDVYGTKPYWDPGAFIALNKNTGKAQCWGSSRYGGACGDVDFAGVTDVYSTAFAFMALNKNTGKGQCWGYSTSGGSCSGLDFAGVTDVYSNGWAFMALNKNNGNAQCWGSSWDGGSCSDIDFEGVTHVVGTQSNEGCGAFVALNKNTGKAQCWGSPYCGGACGAVDFAGITDVYSTEWAFMALDKNTGRAQCWGSSRNGGSCSDLDFAGVTDIYSTGSTFMALNKNTGKAQCWGSSRAVGSCSTLDFSGVTDVYSTGDKIVALSKNTSKVVCWPGNTCDSIDSDGLFASG